jgi:hypothetical protein
MTGACKLAVQPDAVIGRNREIPTRHVITKRAGGDSHGRETGRGRMAHEIAAPAA